MSNQRSVLQLFRRGGHGTEISVSTLALLCGLSFDETDEIVAELRRDGILTIGQRGGIAPTAGFVYEIVEEAQARRRAAKEERKARRLADKARSDAARAERVAAIKIDPRNRCACGAELKYGGTMCRRCYIGSAHARMIEKRAADKAAQFEARLKKAEAKKIARAARIAAQAEERTKPKRHVEPTTRVPWKPPSVVPTPPKQQAARPDPWAIIRERTYGKPKPVLEVRASFIRPLTKEELQTGRTRRRVSA